MCSLMEAVVGGIVGAIVVPISGFVAKKVGYAVNFKKNMKMLEDENKNLETKIEVIEGKCKEAETRGKKVKEDVDEWIKIAKKKKVEVEEFIAKGSNENMKCPKLISRYRMSKKSAKWLDDLKKCIEDGNFDGVADRAPRPLERQCTSSGDFVWYTSREPILKKIEAGLTNPAFKMIGVYGTGGIGKTRAVKEIKKRVVESGIFDEAIIVVVSQEVNVSTIQKEIAYQLSLSFEKETENERADELWNRLRNGKNNLVILDDIWETLDLKKIGIPVRDGNKGCKVILTTRSRVVLEKMNVDEDVSVQVLSKEESWDLFEKTVGIPFVSNSLCHVAKSICKKCGGLPVAILAVGGALEGNINECDWNDALDRMENCSIEKIEGIDRDMYASLRLSYDYLEKEALGKEAKSILLICCLYPEDANIPIDLLAFHCIGRGLFDLNENTVKRARGRTSACVRFLNKRSLLLDGEHLHSVKMHDVIREVILSIAKTDEQYQFKNIIDKWRNEYIKENSVAVSLRISKLKEVPNKLECPRIHTLRIECTDPSFQFPDSFFNGVTELRILELVGINMRSPPSSLANLSKLRTLILVDYYLENMSFLSRLKSNLEVVVIENSSLEALPTELGELSHLRVLLLTRSNKLKLIPAGVISKLTHLEELCLPDNFNFCEELPSSELNEIDVCRATLSELSSLRKLTSLSVFIPDITLVPDLNYENLVSFRVAVGVQFGVDEIEPLIKKLGEWDAKEIVECLRTSEGGQYNERKILKLAGITYDDKLACLLKRVEVLFLYRVEGLNRIGNRFLELEHLVISDCSDQLNSFSLKNQGPYQHSFSKLSVLKVYCCRFKYLFTSSCAQRLELLRELDIRYCYELEEIVGAEGEKDELIHFSKLNLLRMEKLPKLISFGPKLEKNDTAEGELQPLFNEKVTFPSLERLEIDECLSITELWDKQVLPTVSFPQLAHVDVFRCHKLMIVFPSNMLTLVQNLKKIQIRYCDGVEFVVSDVTGVEESQTANNQTISFPYLREVTLLGLENLKSFCGSLSSYVPQHLFGPQVQIAERFIEILYLTRENICRITKSK